MRYFLRRNGFPGIIGIVDGSHVEIPEPFQDGETYYNRKKFPSIQFQVSMKSTALVCFVLWPASDFKLKGYCIFLKFQPSVSKTGN